MALTTSTAFQAKIQELFKTYGVTGLLSTTVTYTIAATDVIKDITVVQNQSQLEVTDLQTGEVLEKMIDFELSLDDIENPAVGDTILLSYDGDGRTDGDLSYVVIDVNRIPQMNVAIVTCRRRARKHTGRNYKTSE